MDDVQAKLDEIARVIESARGLPMSASCVVNRAELLAQIGDLRSLVPQSLRTAQRVIRDAENVVAQAQQEAEAIVAEAHDEREEMLTQTSVYAQGVRAAERLTQDAANLAETMRSQVDDYVDAKLANFEIVLSKTLASVAKGRQKLAGRNEFGEFAEDEGGGFPG